MNKASLIVLVVAALGAATAVFYFNFTLFVVQPIGAVPEGVVLIIPRSSALNFVDSADALCERLMGGVSLMCRLSMLTEAVDPEKIYLRLPYQDWLYSYSTGGRSYGR